MTKKNGTRTSSRAGISRDARSVTTRAVEQRRLGRALSAVAILYLMSVAEAPTAIAAQEGQCSAPKGRSVICGISNVEDMVPVPKTGWVVASSLTGPQVTGDKLYFIDRRSFKYRSIDPSAVPSQADPQFSECPGKPDPGSFRGHGLAIGTEPLRLYAVNHGNRESVEIFDIVTSAPGTEPSLRWAGCVIAPSDVSINAVAAVPGGIAVTRFYDRRETQQQWVSKLMSGEPTGLVLEWKPGAGWSRAPESAMSGTNGLLVDPEGKAYFVAEWATGRLVRLSRGAEPTRRESIETGFKPDNLRWDEQGRILVSGQFMDDMPASFACMANEAKPCVLPYGVLRVDPVTMEAERIIDEKAPQIFGSATVAIDVGEELWLGTMRGDAILRVHKRGVK